MIIDFIDDAHEVFPRELLASFNPKTDRLQPQVNALIKSYEARLGFTRVLATTWVGSSVTAHLTEQQIETLKIDPLVKLLTEDTYNEYSSPLWYPAWNGAAWGELNDWGRVAVGGKEYSSLPYGSPTVYVIDSGIAVHDDLTSVIGRVNVACGAGSTSGQDCVNAPDGFSNRSGYYSPVGCNAHATHVAGIVGASAGNGKNRAGILAGVPMVSIAVGTSPQPETNNPSTQWFPCATAVTSSAVGAAFDYIYQQIRPYGPNWITAMAVATMSINTGAVGIKSDGTSQTNRDKLLALVNPATVWYYNQGVWGQAQYPGVFFTHSAGNDAGDSCSEDLRPLPLPDGGGRGSAAFKAAAGAASTAVDGIMVVGAIKDDANAAMPFANSQPNLYTGEAGSNYGKCIDIWAPGDFIYSLWGHGPGTQPWSYSNSTLSTESYTGGQPSSYVRALNEAPDWAANPGWMWLSGTSMAAPHVAAAGAYVAGKYNLQTPAEVEAKLRELWQYFGTTDAASQRINVVHLGP